MDASLKPAVAGILSQITELRHELHRHPEIRFEERWTSDRIARFLAQEGIPHTRGHARGTGIVARIKGKGGKVVVLRADIDALEIQEETGLPYASEIPQRMHACGHDGHTAILCGVAKLLHARRQSLNGTVKLIFQPAEEQAAGGRYIVDEGLIDDAEAVFALHCWPTLPVGAVGVKPGKAMASADFFHIEIRGRGCHGADPAAGVDPIVVASHITIALQNIVSREINPWDPAVVTVARIQGGVTSNVIPERAWLEGTLRALDERVRQKLLKAVERIARLTAEAHRAEAVVTFGDDNYPALFNDAEKTAFARETVRRTFGEGAVVDLPYPTMGAEDFAFYLQKKPGSFLFLGNNPSKTDPYPPLHSPRFNFNDDALPYGIELMASLAIHALNET